MKKETNEIRISYNDDSRNDARIKVIGVGGGGGGVGGGGGGTLTGAPTNTGVTTPGSP